MVMKVGDRVQFWTMEECKDYYQGAYLPTPGVNVDWGGKARIIEAKDNNFRIEFEDGRTTWCGKDTIHKLPLDEFEERVVFWEKRLT